MTNLNKIQDVLRDCVLPVDTRKVTELLVKRYGSTIRYWQQVLSKKWLQPQTGLLLAEYERVTLPSGRIVIRSAVGTKRVVPSALNNPYRVIMPLKRGTKRGYYSHDEEIEHLARLERITWQVTSESSSIATQTYISLTTPEAFLEQDIISDNYTDNPYPSLWDLVEDTCWLFCNNITRPKDAYGRSGNLHKRI